MAQIRNKNRVSIKKHIDSTVKLPHRIDSKFIAINPIYIKFLLSIGLSIFGIGITSTFITVAQTSPQTPQATPDNSLPLIQATPLFQATSRLLAQSSYYTESKIEINDCEASRRHRTTDTAISNALIKTTVAAPNKFNTEITFVGNNELSDRKYQIISDGVKVWIYDIAQNQYSIDEYQQFIKSPSGLAVGMLSNFYLKTLNSVNNNPVAVNTLKQLPPERLVRYFQRFANIDLQNMEIRNEQIENTAYVVYDADASDRTFKVMAYVAPQSANIERIELSGKKDGLNLTVKEKIISQTVPESIPADLFSFIPPEDARVAEQIAIEPL